MDPAIREHFRMNRHQLEYMQNERKELLRLAAIHQLERERREMIEEEQRAVKMREIQIAEELERKKIAEKLAADRRYLGKIPIKPDMNRKIPKYTKPRKKTPTFQKTTSTPKGSSPMQNQHRRISNNNTLSGRQAKTASDHADVQRAHAKTNRVTLTK
jgi:thioesterase domain-containing protein